MSHVNTLEVYDKYKSAGLNEAQAREYTDILENAWSTKWNELSKEFASQKLVGILGALILTVGIASIGMLWKLSVDVEVLRYGFTEIKADISELRTQREMCK